MDDEHHQRLELQERDYRYQRELQKQRDRSEIANQLVRAGMLMNGGGAVALLAFIQASVESAKFVELARWAAAAILVFVLGLVVVGAANYLRIKVSLRDNDPDSFRKRARIGTSRAFQFGSFVLFMIGCGVFAAAIFNQYGLPWTKTS